MKTILLTDEELDAIREQYMARAEEVEWQLRREISRLREIEDRMLAALGELGLGTAAPEATPAAAPERVRRQPPPPPVRRALGTGPIPRT